MSISTLSLVESLLLHDRPAAWWGLDTADPLADDSVHGTSLPAYTLTAVGTPSDAASLHTRGDTGAAGCRDFNGTTGGYFTAGTLTADPEGFPNFVAAGPLASGTAASVIAPFRPDEGEVGDLALMVLTHSTNTATISTPPSGWTQVGSTQNNGTSATAVYKRTLDGTEAANYSVTWSTTGTLLAQILVWTGLDPTVSGLIFDSNQQVTSSGTFHTTTTETNPVKALGIAIWSAETTATITELEGTTIRNRSAQVSSNLQFRVTEYELDAAGSSSQIAYTSTAVALGVFYLTFGSPLRVTRDILDTISETLTLRCLISADTLSGTDTIIRKHQSWGLHTSGTTLQFLYRDGGGTDRTISGPTLATATTYRLWVVDDGSNIHFYVNGTKTSVARTGTAGYTTNTNRVSIGHYFDGTATSNFFDGRIDELAVLAAPLTNDMIATHEEAATQGTFGQHLQAAASRFPRGKIEIAINSNPTDSCHAFTNVTPDVRTGDGIAIRRGRNFELDRMEAGTMSLTLDNRDAAYTSLKPTRVIRFRAQTVTDGVVYPVFFGYTDAPRHVRPAMGHDTVVSLTAADIFKALALDKVKDATVRGTEYPGERIQAVLGVVDGLLFSLETGVHRIIGDDLQGVNRLEHCQACAETDGGVFFADGRGRAIFQDNQYRSKNERTVRATYGWANTTATHLCSGMTPEVDESRLFTAAAVTPASGNVQRASHETAVLEYFERTKEVTTLHASDRDALALAHHIVNAYSTPLIRIKDLELKPAGSPSATMWALVLGHEISHRIKTVEKPVGASSEVAREHFIEGVEHALSGSQWTVRFALSPTDLEGKYFIIGTSEIGDQDAVIGW